MIHNMAGGGGAGLNFKIIGGTTEPSNPSKNTIWIKTDTPISGYSFRTDQPTGSEGLIWIVTGSSSAVPFNALKKNSILVYPRGAKQYIDGAWESREAYLYDGTSWVQFSSEVYYLFDNGDVTEVTGGWTKTAGSYSSGSTSVGSTLKLYVSKPSAAVGTEISLAMKNSINVANYKTLCISWTGCGYSAGDTSDGRGYPWYEVRNGSTVLTSGNRSAPSGTTRLDISSLSSLKLAFAAGVNYYQGGAVTLNVDQIWLEE